MRKTVTACAVIGLVFVVLFSCTRSSGSGASGPETSILPAETEAPVFGLSNGFVFSDPPSGTFLVGYSSEDRKIEITRVGSGSEKALVLVGGIHGEEANTIELVKALRIAYTDNPDSVPPEYSMFFMDVLNADGYAAGTRENSHKVDLNRNFPTNDWIADAYDMKETVPGTGGSGPASEPEVYALKAFLLEYLHPLFSEIRVLVFHSACPPVGYIQPGYLKNGEPELRSASLAEQLAKIGGYKFLRAWVDKKPITGELICFCAQNNILSMDIELPTYDMPDVIPAGKKESTYDSCARLVARSFGMIIE